MWRLLRSRVPQPHTSSWIPRIHGPISAESFHRVMGGENARMSARLARERADAHPGTWPRDSQVTWGYSRQNGPDKWWVHFPKAGGGHQSPIDIHPEHAQWDRDLSLRAVDIRCDTDEGREVRITNTGHGWRVDLRDNNAYITGGPADGRRFCLEQFHMHWGEDDHRGSEHTLRGNQFAGELHCVYWNSEYGSFAAAAEQTDGLLVTAVWLQLDTCEGARGLELLDIVTQCCHDIPYPGNSGHIPAHVNTLCLTPEKIQSYWTYHGSLTTPPCHESVTWLVFHQSLPITPQQLERCRSLHTSTHGSPCIEIGGDDTGNRTITCFRPVQPLGNRVVRTTDEHCAEHCDSHEQSRDRKLFASEADFRGQY